MKLFSMLFVGVSLMTASFLTAAPDQNMCRCKDCKCTQESHCGCMNNRGCHCVPGNQCCGENCPCGSGCGCGNGAQSTSKTRSK